MPSEENNIGVIPMHEFLDFLKITCQVNESIDGKNNSSQIDYNQLAKNELVNNLLSSQSSQMPFVIEHHTEIASDVDIKEGNNPNLLREKSREKNGNKRKTLVNAKSYKSKTETSGDYRGQLHPVLSDKLNEVINEGILDSVLPYVCPVSSTSSINSQPKIRPLNPTPRVQTQQIFDFKPPQLTNTDSSSPSELSSKKSPRPTDTITITNNLGIPGRERIRRKSMSPMSASGDRNDVDVIIHVCDEVKGVSRDFTCPQKLLVSKMGYFADVTNGSKQRLEDMDISVHCDLLIFEWLMKWVKRDAIPSDDYPSLEPSNVIPILVSASFLQMEPLLLDCLSFCHARLNEIVKTSSNLSCLNDSIIARLAAMFTNLELEMVRDKKDRVAPRLWTKLIQSLCEPEPQSLRGHYASLAGLFRCTRCGKILTPSVSSYVHCLPQNMRINRWGQLVSQHSKDTNWSITNFVIQLHKELKSWRKVYWRLWGHCHFLFCTVCETHFPTYQMLWCQFHPDQPQFLGPVTEGKTPGPGGRYPCCNQPAFRYETISGPTGCEEREHSIQIETDRDRAVLQLSQIAAEGGCLFEAPPSKSNNNSMEPWWTGIAILPHRSRLGLLPCLHNEENVGRITHRGAISKMSYVRQSSMFQSSSGSESSGEKDTPIHQRYTSSSDGGESDENSPKRYGNRRKVTKRRTKPSTGRYWSGDVSARSNQDNQREYEERAMKQVIAIVGKKTGTDTSVNYHTYQQGGSYVRLEVEWRENLKQKANSKTRILAK